MQCLHPDSPGVLVVGCGEGVQVAYEGAIPTVTQKEGGQGPFWAGGSEGPKGPSAPKLVRWGGERPSRPEGHRLGPVGTRPGASRPLSPCLTGRHPPLSWAKESTLTIKLSCSPKHASHPQHGPHVACGADGGLKHHSRWRLARQEEALSSTAGRCRACVELIVNHSCCCLDIEHAHLTYLMCF